MEEKKIQYIPMDIYPYPRKENIIGQAKEFIDDFLTSMKSEQLYNMMGVKPDKSFLITGSQGNGKTHSLDALVNEANKETYENVLADKIIKPNLFGFKYDIGKYGTAYINEGSKIIQGFFDTCFTVAQKGYKTLAIFDEADNLFGHRTSTHSHKEDSKVLATIMKNMQRLHDTDNMYLVLMSNFPDAFDKASIRAGRIDKKYVFSSPNESEREMAYTHAINQINEKAGYMVVRGYNTRDLAKISNNFSYSDVIESINSAVKQRVKEICKVRKNKIITAGYVNQKRLEDSVNSHKSSFVKTKKVIGFN